MSTTTNSSGFQLLRGFVFTLNLLFWLIGLGVLGLALWLHFDPSVAQVIALNDGHHNFYLASWLLIVSGAIMTIVGFFGCCGAWRLSQCMLLTFFIILVVVFCLEIACAVIAYTHQDLWGKFLHHSFYDAVQKHYGRRPEYTRILDQIQTEFHCCGVRSYKDWLHSSWGRNTQVRAEIGIGSGTIGRVPKSCCNDDGLRDYPTNCGVSFDKLELWTYESFLHPKGCSDVLYELVHENLRYVIVVSVISAILQLFGMFLSILLCCWIGTERRYKYEAPY
jgi:hypothetical protein